MPQPTSKIANLGDGFIVRAIERLLGKFPPALTFTSRALPASEQISQMQKCSWVILAGANQLTDDFTVWPGFDGAALARTGLRLAPMGIGIHGEPRRNAGMTAATRAILAQIHERLDNSSWRCPRTVDYLERSLPHLRGRFLMTGCPVLYAKPLLNESRFGRSEDTVAVTSTERGDFWKREAATIEFVARRFSASRRLMVIHQDYARAAAEGKLRRKLSSLFAGDKVSALRKLASARGFEVMVPATADEALSLYAKVDLHIGSRLHAHLHMLSRNRRSFLTKVDERVTGFAEHFGFPICDPLRLGDYMEFDFEPVRERARRTFDTMLKFVDSLGRAA